MRATSLVNKDLYHEKKILASDLKKYKLNQGEAIGIRCHKYCVFHLFVKKHTNEIADLSYVKPSFLALKYLMS